MSDTVIQVRGLSKQYRLGKRQAYKTFRESIIDTLSAPFKSFRKAPLDDTNSFWALKDVNFDIKQGEVVGVIGRNGAGKSTLLKILSRITEPTEGEIDITGRIGSLLEVGTGFHPELTGRENIYLNGAILGMRRVEVKKKFDEIVAFAETEKFLDTPVKHYSSGMYTRLAFAVAAHLEPEILIVDEVLAVGDAQFQQKCLGKMKDVAGHGRTVLFVSHNMAAIRVLCTHGIMLGKGKVLIDDTIEKVVSQYLNTVDNQGSTRVGDRKDRGGNGNVRIQDITLLSKDGNPVTTISVGDSIKIVVDLTSWSPSYQFLLALYSQDGQIVSDFATKYTSANDDFGNRDSKRLICSIPSFTLVPGRYRMNVAIFDHNSLEDHIEGAMAFEVEEGALDGRPVPNGVRGAVAIGHRWRAE